MNREFQTSIVLSSAYRRPMTDVIFGVRIGNLCAPNPIDNHK